MNRPAFLPARRERAVRDILRSLGWAVVLFWALASELEAQQAVQNTTVQDTIPSDTTRIDPLRNNNVDMTGDELAADPFANSWPLFGSGARMAIRGYVKLDYVQDFNGAYDRFQFPIAQVPVRGDGRPEQSAYMNFFARESRISFDVRSVTERGTPLQVFLEMDFWNTEDTPFFATPRLRHFYGVYGPVLAGRTWGTLTDVYSLATTLDFAAGDAISGSRRPQVRWEQTLSDGFKGAVALEMLEFVDIDNVADQPGEASQRLPLLAARTTRTTNRGRLMLGGSVFELRWDGLGEISNATTVGWGVLLSGRLGLGKRDYLLWNASGGNGWGSNIATAIGTGSSAVLTPDGTLDPLFAWNVQVGGVHYLSNVVALNLSLAWASVEDSPDRPGTSLKEGGTAHVNIVWSPVKSVNTGVEYMLGLRRNYDGADGTAHRLQAMIKYIF
jgi:hypothetical protein